MTLTDKVLANSKADGDCLLWQGAMAGGICPSVRLDGKTVVVRRAVWSEMGRKLDKRSIVPTCGEATCVAPEHLGQARRGPKVGSKKTLLGRHNIAVAVRARSKLTPAEVEAIRSSDELPRVLSDRHGISRTQVRNIKARRCWGPLSTPFAGLYGTRR